MGQFDYGGDFTWEPGINGGYSPGFKATMESIIYAMGFEDVDAIGKTRIFIDKLEDEGYCIALYKPD